MVILTLESEDKIIKVTSPIKATVQNISVLFSTIILRQNVYERSPVVYQIKAVG